jgi:hypothetical protein
VLRYWMSLMIVVPLLASPAPAVEIGGASLPDSLTVEDRDLVLNGAGLRKKFFVKVYAMGLYLTEKMQDPERIIQADEPMAARMHFIYDGVSSEDLVDAWQEGFENAAGGGDLGALRERVETFNGYFTGEAAEGDVYEFIYLPGEGVLTVLDGEVAGTLPGLDFKQALFRIWLGEEPADATLKQGMLGR